MLPVTAARGTGAARDRHRPRPATDKRDIQEYLLASGVEFNQPSVRHSPCGDLTSNVRAAAKCPHLVATTGQKQSEPSKKYGIRGSLCALNTRAGNARKRANSPQSSIAPELPARFNSHHVRTTELRIT
jgi:hypothetical protein